MGKDIIQPDLDKKSLSPPSYLSLETNHALYSALSGFAINGVNMTKLQSFPERIHFHHSFFYVILMVI